MNLFSKSKPLILSEKLILRLPLLTDYNSWVILRRKSEDFLNKWATRGEKHTSYFISSPRVTSFIFKSAKLKKLKDTQMLTWENERSERLRKARLRIYGEDKSAYPVIKKTEKDERDVEALEYYEANNIDYSTDNKIFI